MKHVYTYQIELTDRQLPGHSRLRRKSSGIGFVFMIHLSRAQFREDEQERKRMFPKTTDHDLIIYFNLTTWGQAEFSMTHVLFEEPESHKWQHGENG